MIDLGISKMALIGAVALIVIGPEKLPRVARTVGALIGKAQRYVSDVKAEVNRSMELDELRKMKENVETAARDVEQSVQTAATDFEKDWSAANPDLTGLPLSEPLSTPVPEYRNPGKKMALEAVLHAELVQSTPRHAHQGLVGRGPRGTLSSPSPFLRQALSLYVRHPEIP